MKPPGGRRRCPTAARAALFLGLLGSIGWGGFAIAGPADAVAYGPVPPGIDAVAVGEQDEALASMALAALVQPADRATPSIGHDTSRALLVMLADAGLRAVARRLAEGGVPEDALPHLLLVVATSDHPEADLLLERAAREHRPVLRMLAADGLGLGRTPRAVPVLAELARDAVPAVRAAALRSLFALESEQAVAARKAVPPDVEVGLLAARLRWHHICGDTSEALLATATEAYRRGRTVALRMVAARYLTLPGLGTPPPLLKEIVEEMGTTPVLARVIRWANGRPREGYDPVEMRRVAIEAAFSLLGREGLPEDLRRAYVVERAVGWIARPVPMDSRGQDPIPEYRLRRRLPDLGQAILPTVVAYLDQGRFRDPRAGVLLLRELGRETALPVLRRLLQPREAKPPFESHAEAEHRRYLRMAAAGAIQEFGQIGDEALARALLAGDEPRALKTEIVRALAGDPGAWVVPLLGELAAGSDRELRSYALDGLEGRHEAEARALLVEDLFKRVEQPHNRIVPLVRSADEAAFQVLGRALADSRPVLRKAALQQFHRVRNPGLCGREGRLLLRTFEPDLRSAQEIQGYVYALLSTEPRRAVRYVRETWNRFPTDAVRATCLRLLQETLGTAARREAIDFALELDAPGLPVLMQLNIGAVLRGQWDYRRDEVCAFWGRLLQAAHPNLRWNAVWALGVPGGPDVSAQLVAQLRQALAPRDPDEEERDPVDRTEYACDVMRAMRHQPFEQVEGALIDVATDPLNVDTTRETAAQVLFGKLSDDGRRRLMAWLDYTPSSSGRAPGVLESDAVQLNLAAAIGEGAGAAEAGVMLGALRRELFAFYTPERMGRLLPGPGSGKTSGETSSVGLAEIDANVPSGRFMALARGIAHTRHAPSVAGLLDLAFDLRFALYARSSVQRQLECLQQAGPGAAAAIPSKLEMLAHRREGVDYFGMPPALYHVLSQVKVLEDDVLARALERVLQAARDDGRLAHFPDIYVWRLTAALLDKQTGAKPASAEVVHRFMKHVEATDSAVDFFEQWQRSSDLSMAGRWREALAAQRHVVRILARRNHRDREPAVWHLQRARLDALEGAALAADGQPEQARDCFRRAVLRAPNDPDVLNTVAWERAMARFDLHHAEAEARLATVLEARVDSRPTLNAADTLAYVLLLRGKPHEAVAVFEPRMGEHYEIKDGLLHLHMAQMYAAVGRAEDCVASLVKACTWDRTLEATLEQDPYLKPVFEEAPARLPRVLRAAAAKRSEENLQ